MFFKRPKRLFIVAVFFQLLLIIAFLWLAYAGVEYVHKHGLKKVATEFWEGTDSTSTK